MKKTLYFILASLFAVNMQAQVIDKEGLQTFINELKALDGEHVECQNQDYNIEFPNGYVSFKFNGEDAELTGVTTSDTTFFCISIISEDKTGYNLVQGVLCKYYDEESEDIFGIPLFTWQRVDGDEEIMFMDGSNTLLVKDDGDEEIMVTYINYNLKDVIKGVLHNIIEQTDEEYVDVEMFGGLNFGVNVTDADEFRKDSRNVYQPTANGDDIMALVRTIYEDNLLHIEELIAGADSTGEQEELAASLVGFKEEQGEHLEELERELEELDVPSFIEIIPGSNEYYVAIPRVPAHLKENVKPYAAKGIYDWINMYYCFRAGAKVDYTDVISCIITPHDVAREYIIRNCPREKWYADGFTPGYKEFAAVEYQGCMPAVLYSFSQIENGYNEMLREFGDLFRRETGEKILGLEVTQNSVNNGKRFVQLWGEGGILMCIYDSPAEKYCHMSIIVGGISGFEHAVNEYCFGGEKDFAKRYNIVIDSDLSNNSYGIHFVNDEYFYAGKSHRNGVHIDFGYARMFLK
jgi:hypothetical protein